MSLLTEQWVPKEVSRRPQTHYDARIVHAIEQGQPVLQEALEQLHDVASDFIDFVPIGKLSITLCNIGPAVRSALHPDKKGNIAEYARRDFEAELHENLPFTQTPSNPVTVHNPTKPLGLFGSWSDQLGIRLQNPNPFLVGERLLIESYIQDTYSVSERRFGADSLAYWEPHIKLGTIKYEKFGKDQQYALRQNPSDFMASMVESPDRLSYEEYNLPMDIEPIAIPETIGLSGLRVVCDKEPRRGW